MTANHHHNNSQFQTIHKLSLSPSQPRLRPVEMMHTCARHILHNTSKATIIAENLKVVQKLKQKIQ